MTLSSEPLPKLIRRSLATGALGANRSVTQDIPVVNCQQMQLISRLMVEEYGIGHLQMLENAGRALAVLGRKLLSDNLNNKRLTILCGAGECGAAGMVTARYLHNWGAQVIVIMSRPVDSLGNMARNQQRILARLGVPLYSQTSLPPLRLLDSLRQSEMIFDALIGWGLQARLYGNEAFLVQVLSQVKRPVIALDLPSGLPSDKETPFEGGCVKAMATLTLAFPKTGLLRPIALPFVGDLYLADIGVPGIIYQQLGLKINSLFAAGEILQLLQRTE